MKRFNSGKISTIFEAKGGVNDKCGASKKLMEMNRGIQMKRGIEMKRTIGMKKEGDGRWDFLINVF